MAQLVYRVRIDDRLKEDFITAGGALGRWAVHCHIFFHAGLGMISQLVIIPFGTGRRRYRAHAYPGVVDGGAVVVGGIGPNQTWDSDMASYGGQGRLASRPYE